MNDLRKYFRLPDTGGYFNCAAQGPLTTLASEALIAGIRDKENPASMDMTYGANISNSARETVADFVGCSPAQVALGHNTGSGMSVLVRGLDFKPGDEVLLFDGQFPSNVAPWETLSQKGVNVKKLPISENFTISLKDFKNALKPKTRVAVLEWVHFISGERIPLAEMTALAHKNGTLVFVDVTQGLGTYPFSINDYPVDAVCSSAYKWLLSPYGSGFMVLSQKALDQIIPRDINWLSLKSTEEGRLHDFKIDLCSTARKFDSFALGGFLNMQGMTASLKFLSELNLNDTSKQVRKLNHALETELPTDRFELLNDGPEDFRSLISTFRIKIGDGAKLAEHLKTNGFSITYRNLNLRISPNIYNTTEEVSNLVRTIQDFRF